MGRGTIRITVETQSTLIIRGVNPVLARCPRCAAEVDTVVLEVAGVLARMDQSTIQPSLGTQELHQTRMSGGLARMCWDFLLRSARRVLPKPQIRNTSK
jgi:hypothetical protein